MDRERLILVFKMCALAVEAALPFGQPLDVLATQFGARFKVTREEAREVLAMTLRDVAGLIAGGARPGGSG